MAGLLQSVGNMISGAFGGDTGAPKMQTIPLDQNTQKLISDSLLKASQSPDQYAAQANEGVGENPFQDHNASASTGQNAGMLQAIKNQYKSYANRDIGRLVQNNELNKNIMKAQRLSQIQGAVQAQANVQAQAQEMQAQNYMQQQQIRGQLVSSLINLGISGYAMAGGFKSSGNSGFGTGSGGASGGDMGGARGVGQTMNPGEF